MEYRFYVNTQKNSEGDWIGSLGYEPGHTLRLMHQGDVAANDDLHACEFLFGQFNINHPANYRISTGDVVVLEGTRAYACDDSGFKSVALSELVVLSGGN